VSGLLTIALLVLVALAMVFAEFFVPSFGLLSLCALGMLVTAGILAFREGAAVGSTTVGLALVLLALDILLAIRLLPRSPLILRSRSRPTGGGRSLHDLLGKAGTAQTDLRPVGCVVVEGRRCDALSRRGWVAKGTRVRVIAVEGAQVVVTPDEPPEAG